MLAFKCEKKAITVGKANQKGHCITIISGKRGPESATRPQRREQKFYGSKTKKRYRTRPKAPSGSHRTPPTRPHPYPIWLRRWRRQQPKIEVIQIAV